VLARERSWLLSAEAWLLRDRRLLPVAPTSGRGGERNRDHSRPWRWQVKKEELLLTGGKGPLQSVPTRFRERADRKKGEAKGGTSMALELLENRKVNLEWAPQFSIGPRRILKPGVSLTEEDGPSLPKASIRT